MNINTDDPITVLEFFSGIGGMHYGMKWAGLRNLSVIPFDINPNANQCYEFNFKRQVIQKSIESLSPKELDSYNARIWTMSPPCQPFTRTGKQLDDQDPRSAALLHLIHLLPQLTNIPDYIFLENVEAFYGSQSHERLIRVLVRELSYDCVEFVISPTDLGIPNHRPRYYLCAKRKSNRSSVEVNETMNTHSRIEKWDMDPLYKDPDPRSRLAFYLEQNLNWNDSEPYRIPSKRIKSSFPSSIIVQPNSKNTNCFTKAYASYCLSSGSYLQTMSLEIDPSTMNDPHEAIRTCGIRRLTPIEIARLHGFPVNMGHVLTAAASDQTCETFTFPSSMTLDQQWKVLGNSLNVVVVGELMRRVLFI